MGKCWDITKQLRFCRNSAGEGWFCDTHAAQPKYFLVTALGAIVFSYVAGLIPNPWESKGTIVPDPLSQQVGSLKPKHPTTYGADGTFPGGVATDQRSQVIAVQVSDGAIVQPFGRYAPFSVRSTKDGILISAVIHSLDGKIIAKIHDNEWVLNPNNFFQKNFDRSALEVIDEYDIPVLQVEYLDENRLKIGGVFHLEEKEISELYPDFPSAPKEANPRALFSFRGVILIVGENGSSTIARSAGPEELRARAGLVALRSWFDYSKPGKLGLRRTPPAQTGN